MLQLSNLNRLRAFCAGKSTTPIASNLATGVANTRLLSMWLASTSQQIEDWLNRDIQIASYTEYFDISMDVSQFFIKGAPIVSITTVKEDPSGQFDGDESTLASGSEYYIGPDSRSVVLDIPRSWEKERGLQVVYTGGLAYHGTQSIMNITGLVGVPTARKVVIGGTSGAVATVVSYDAGNSRLTVDSYYGTFQAGETLTEYDNDVDLTASGVSCVFATMYRQALSESHPKLVTACEMQIRFNWKHGTDFEDSAMSKDNTVIGSDIRTDIAIRPEVLNMIRNYRIMMI